MLARSASSRAAERELHIPIQSHGLSNPQLCRQFLTRSCLIIVLRERHNMSMVVIFVYRRTENSSRGCPRSPRTERVPMQGPRPPRKCARVESPRWSSHLSYVENPVSGRKPSRKPSVWTKARMYSNSRGECESHLSESRNSSYRVSPLVMRLMHALAAYNR